MARRKNGSSTKRTDFKLVFVEFSVNDRIEVNEWIEGKEEPGGDDILDWTERGWKVSFSYSGSWKNHVITVTGKETGTSYDGQCYLVRHPEFSKCFQLARYVIEVMVPAGHRSLNADLGEDDW